MAPAFVSNSDLACPEIGLQRSLSTGTVEVQQRRSVPRVGAKEPNWGRVSN